MDVKTNRREFTRVQVRLDVELRTGGAASVIGRLSNVSINGFHLVCDTRLPERTTCEITLVLDGGLGNEYVKAVGQVVRVDQTGMAIHIKELLGEQSLTHLQNIVLYNSGDDTNRVEQEFAQHIGLKPIE